MFLAVDVSGLGLHRMSVLGREHGDVITCVATVLDEVQGHVVGDTEDISWRAFVEFDRKSVSAEHLDFIWHERRKGFYDFSGIA